MSEIMDALTFAKKLVADPVGFQAVAEMLTTADEADYALVDDERYLDAGTFEEIMMATPNHHLELVSILRAKQSTPPVWMVILSIDGVEVLLSNTSGEVSAVDEQGEKHSLFVDYSPEITALGNNWYEGRPE